MQTQKNKYLLIRSDSTVLSWIFIPVYTKTWYDVRYQLLFINGKQGEQNAYADAFIAAFHIIVNLI